MADTAAIQFVESLLQRTDAQTRAILGAQQPGAAEVDTINVLIGDGATAMAPGIAALIRVDFKAQITGSFVQEFDGTTGSIILGIAKAVPGTAPIFTSITGATPPTIAAGRYAADEDLVGWTTSIDRGDILRFSITSATTITRVLAALRIRRLEP